jgi:hypothetical protein
VSQIVRTIVLGGSNTVITGGYLDSLLHICRAEGTELTILANHSVGNTTVGYGLLLMKCEPLLRDCDLLLIEYAINDDFSYGTSEALLHHWGCLFEGLIRYARSINPGLHIMTILLATRSGEWARTLPQIASRALYISTNYSAHCVDVNRAILNRYGEAVMGDSSFYAEGDDSHYSRPLATALVANTIATSLLNRFRRDDHTPYRLPPPVNRDECSSASVITLEQIAETLKRSPQPYRNWRFNASAVNIAGTELAITLRGGTILGLEYICESHTSNLFLNVPGSCTLVGTMKFGVRNGSYKFLTSYLPTEFLFPRLRAQTHSGEHTITLRTNGTHTCEYTPRDGAPLTINNDPTEAPVFPLGRILHTGTLISVRALP